MTLIHPFSALLMLGLVMTATAATALDNPNSVTWQGTEGPGKGKRIVYLAGDH